MESTSASGKLNSAIERLREAGVETPQLDAQLLMAKALGCSRIELIAHPERLLNDARREAFQAMLDKRTARYPLAYILGSKEFYGIEINVTPAVLIPRPETEILVEECLKRVGDSAKIADVGTGSGAIAVALAVSLPNARVWATDASEQALEVARANVEKHAVSDRVSMIRGDLLEPIVGRGRPLLGRDMMSRPNSGGWDAIVSNPPYIPTGDIDTLQPEVRYEPREALDGGPDGLDAYRKLLPRAIGITRLVAVEIGAGQAGPVTQIARDAGWREVELVRDLAGIERVVLLLGLDIMSRPNSRA